VSSEKKRAYLDVLVNRIVEVNTSSVRGKKSCNMQISCDDAELNSQHIYLNKQNSFVTLLAECKAYIRMCIPKSNIH